MEFTNSCIVTILTIIFSKIFIVTPHNYNYGMCSDPLCSDPVGFGIAIHQYHSPETNKLSLQVNQEVAIYVKDYGAKKHLLGVMINGRRGYVPKSFIREIKQVAKASFPAEKEFTQAQFMTDSPYMSSHIHESSHIPHDNIYHTTQQSMHNNLQQSRDVQHNDQNFLNNNQQDGQHFQQSNQFQQSDQNFLNSNQQDGQHFQQSNQFQQNDENIQYNHAQHVGQDIHYNGDNFQPSNKFQQNFQSNDQFQTSSHNFQPSDQYQLSSQSFQPNDQFQRSSQSFQSNAQFQQSDHSFQTDQFNGLPLDSSREHTPFHDSSDIYLVPNKDSKFSSQMKNEIPPQIDSSSHEHFGADHHVITSTLISTSEHFGNSERDILVSSNFHQSFENHLENPSFQSQPSYRHEVTGENVRQFTDNHGNFYPDQTSQMFSQSEVTPSLTKVLQSDYTPVSLENKDELEKTLLMLENHGYETKDLKENPHPESIISITFPLRQSKHQGSDASQVYQNELSQSGFSNPSDHTHQSIENKQYLLPHSNVQQRSESEFIKSSTTPDLGYSQSISGTSNVHQNDFIHQSETRNSFSDSSQNFHASLNYQDGNDYKQMSESENIRISSSFNSDNSQSDRPSLHEQEGSQSVFDRKTTLINNFKEMSQIFEEKEDFEYNEEDDEEEDEEEDLVNIGVLLNNEQLDLKKIPPSNDINSATEIFSQSEMLSETTTNFYKEAINSAENVINQQNTAKIISEKNYILNKPSEDISSSDSQNLSHQHPDESDSFSQGEEIHQEIKTNHLSDKNFTFQNEGDLSNVLDANETDINPNIQNFDNLLNVSDIKETESMEYANAFQTRHLKDVENYNENLVSPDEAEQLVNSSEFNLYDFFENSFIGIRSFIETLLQWIPDPLYTFLMDLQTKGVSPKVTVFTALSSIPCVVLIIIIFYIKERSKERKLIAHLTILEKSFYELKEEKSVLEDKLGKNEVELQISKTMLEDEKISSFKLQTEVETLRQQVETISTELEKNIEIIDELKDRERQYAALVRDHEKEHLNLLEQKDEFENNLMNQEDITSKLTENLQEQEAEVQKLLTEKSSLIQANEVCEEKLAQLQKNCNQLLQEAEVWNLRVKELNETLSEELSAKEELKKLAEEKDTEIEALEQAVQLFKVFEEVGNDDEEEKKSNEEKLQYLINASAILIKLQKQEEENHLLSERMLEEKNKLLDMEVVIMDIKSENEKLKRNYNQALQDKTEAQTKLDVLTNYFKDKEIQLQKQLGVQEAVRQKTEQDATSAERKICLIEEENASYKYQVATMKQEMEETERNLKSQIATQEKKAHENWLAARTAERKLEDTKQEVMQLRQRLTLLEREQENWANSARDEIIRPVPKRIGNLNDDSVTNADSNSSLELRGNMILPPPMMLPLDRPLPPLPPLPPPFLPPFEPPPFRPQPWHMPPDNLSNSDYRITPPDFGRGRESTPPRGRNSAHVDGDMGPRQSSPIPDLRDSRNSTPPHLLPDFHDIPPHPPRPPFFPPMGTRSRYPLPPPPNFRRELIQGQRRIDNQDDTSFGSQHSTAPPDNWHNPNSRV